MAASLSFSGFTAAVILLAFFVGFGVCSVCSSTPIHEVESLQQIAREVQKNESDCSTDPCSKSAGNNTCWKSNDDPTRKKYTNLVNCTCLEGIWHITDIYWKGQNLSGVLPKSLSKLRYIKTIDLSRNVLTGTVPVEWIDTKLEFVSLFANRLSGPIPKYLGKITTLTQLSIESNQFYGTVPPELGNLVNLTNLTLSDNKLTGHLPLELKNLSSLTTLLLSSNNFNGSLPDFIKHYPELQYLYMIGSGFEGPIPSDITTLHKLKELRISDLGGEGSKFPSLQKMGDLTTLILRSCNITGEIPPDIGYLKKLIFVDLSFNRLTGSVPTFYYTEHLYLTGNMLNGPVPNWIANADDTIQIDISYNNFTDNPEEALCSRKTINTYRSDASLTTLDSSACLKRLRCPKDRYSLHINCGGPETKIGKITYQQDDEKSGPATFFHEKLDWGFSSSGEFWKPESKTNNYIQQITLKSIGKSDEGLYKDARLSATSLTYYGRCLANGNYTVTLHFSEIVFTDDDTYMSIGRRVFDIFIQEKLYFKDFDIVKEANGTHKAFKKVFSNISVTNSLEIRLYYAGKGSTQIPVKGNYGPLISAISIESQFNPPFDWKIVMWALVAATSLLIGVALVIYWWKRLCTVLLWFRITGTFCLCEMLHTCSELRVLNPQIGLFTYKQIKTACNNFNIANKLGEGGFGSVYKGTLLDGTHIAVKQLSAKSSQGNKEFVNEIGMISSMCHPNLVRLYGCCVDTSQLFLVYEYLVNKDLGHALFGPDDGRLKLDWPIRKRICIGIAKGLAFLHEESRIKIVHRDIKATNVLLDRNLNPKISDFGLARLNEEEVTHISTRIAGTIGYMAPEYALWGYLTPKADVFSFGVVVLEVVAGRSNMKFQPTEDHFCLLDWAYVLKQKGDLMELMDPTLGTDYNKEEASMMIQIALLCTNPSPALRPTMSEALNMLEGNTVVQELILEPNNLYSHEWMYQASKKQQLKQMSGTETQSLIHSPDAPRIDSSSKSAHDLYPVDTCSH